MRRRRQRRERWGTERRRRERHDGAPRAVPVVLAVAVQPGRVVGVAAAAGVRKSARVPSGASSLLKLKTHPLPLLWLLVRTGRHVGRVVGVAAGAGVRKSARVSPGASSLLKLKAHPLPLLWLLVRTGRHVPIHVLKHYLSLLWRLWASPSSAPGGHPHNPSSMTRRTGGEADRRGRRETCSPVPAVRSARCASRCHN